MHQGKKEGSLEQKTSISYSVSLFIFRTCQRHHFLNSLFFPSGCGEQGLLCRDAWTSRCPGFSAVEHGLHCSEPRGVFPDQGLNLCLLH